MKTQQNKLTKIGMILLMAVASVVNTENANAQFYVPGGTVGTSTNSNIGIGTSSPAFKLQVVTGSTGASGIGLYNGNTGGSEIRFQPSAPGSHTYGLQANGTTGFGSVGSFGVYDFNATLYRMLIDANGNVGIGTTSPCEKLSVSGSAQVDATDLNTGTIANALKFGGCSTGEGIGSKRTSIGNQFGLDFYTNSNNRMFIMHNGKVGIGTIDPSTKMGESFMLSVRGKIRTDGLVIKNYAYWADYVFADNYNLTPLNEVEDYINENSHLPGIPSAKEIYEDGIDVATIQSKQMEKIEELTLYMIAMKKEIQLLKEENASMKSSFTNSKN